VVVGLAVTSAEIDIEIDGESVSEDVGEGVIDMEGVSEGAGEDVTDIDAVSDAVSETVKEGEDVSDAEPEDVILSTTLLLVEGLAETE
jgi:cell division ATPase FtsA